MVMSHELSVSVRSVMCGSQDVCVLMCVVCGVQSAMWCVVVYVVVSVVVCMCGWCRCMQWNAGICRVCSGVQYGL